jgi:hypothetical protein
MRMRTRLAILALGLLLLALGLWWAAPAIATAWAGGHLPIELRRGLRVERIAVRGDPPAAPIRVVLSPSQARQIAQDASGRWIPPGLIRRGQWAAGSIAGVPWSLRIADPAVPTLQAQLDRAQAAAIIAQTVPGQIALSLYTGPLVLGLDRLALRVDPPVPPATDMAVDLAAAGVLGLAFDGKPMRFGIRQLAISGRCGLAPGQRGWQPRPELRLDELVFVDGSRPPGLVLALLRGALGRADGPLSELITLPAWLPPELAATVTVE